MTKREIQQAIDAAAKQPPQHIEPFEPFAPRFHNPWPVPIFKKTCTYRRAPVVKKVTHHRSPGLESLPTFRRRMVDQFSAELRKYCTYLRATRLLPGTMPRKAFRDAWFASELDKGKTIREIQEAYFTEAHELISAPTIRKAIQRVRTKPGRS